MVVRVTIKEEQLSLLHEVIVDVITSVVEDGSDDGDDGEAVVIAVEKIVFESTEEVVKTKNSLDDRVVETGLKGQ